MEVLCNICPYHDKFNWEYFMNTSRHLKNGNISGTTERTQSYIGNLKDHASAGKTEHARLDVSEIT